MDTVLRSSYVELQQEHETTILIISKENYGTKGVTSSEATTKRRSSIKQRANKNKSSTSRQPSEQDDLNNKARE